MDKIKSMLKGDSSDSKSDSKSESKYESSSTGNTGTTGTTHHSTPSSTTTSTQATTTRAAPAAVQETYETEESRVAPAVLNETISRTHKDEVQQVMDREKHYDHYHTTVQPVKDREVLPTVHQSQQAAVQEREFEHEDAAKTKAALEAQAAQFKSTRTEGETQKTSTNLGTVVGESQHHHLYETVQPVISKDVIQPSVTHTTIPIHEVHHEKPHFHETTVAPTMSIDEFKAASSGAGVTKETSQ